MALCCVVVFCCVQVKDLLKGPFPQVRKTVFLSHLCINATFYQDRLGTNIGKTHPKDPSNLQITYDQVFAAGGSSKPEAKL